MGTRWRTGVALAAALVGVPVVLIALVHSEPAAAAVACPAAPYGVSRFAPGTGKTVALTFDDGPGRDTGRIISILSSWRVTATFFNLGVYEVNNPAAVRAQRAGGFALGSHGWSHRDLPSLGAAAQADEIDRERAAQASITGWYPCLLRSPYGNYDTTTLSLASQRGMAVWYWSVDTQDWRATGSSSQYWIDTIRARAQAGAAQDHPVILMHNGTGGNPATVAALPSIISFYKARGYRFVDLFGNTGRPVVTGVTPMSGPTRGGTRVAVTGANLRRVHAVYFGTVAGTGLHVVAPSKLLISSPRHVRGVVDIRVVCTQGSSTPRTVDHFRYVPPPSITSMSPIRGPTAGGVRVRISGTAFRRVEAVRFGGYRGGGVHVVDRSLLLVTAPAHAAGVVNVQVVTDYGASAATTASRYHYLAP